MILRKLMFGDGYGCESKSHSLLSTNTIFPVSKDGTTDERRHRSKHCHGNIMWITWQENFNPILPYYISVIFASIPNYNTNKLYC